MSRSLEGRGRDPAHRGRTDRNHSIIRAWQVIWKRNSRARAEGGSRDPGGHRMSWNMFSRFGAGSDPDIVSFGDLEEAIGTNAWTVVDVREPHEFATGHVPNALNHADVFVRSRGAAERKTGRAHLSGGRAVAQCAEQGAGGRPRGRQALRRGHERLALAQRASHPLSARNVEPDCPGRPQPARGL